MDFSNNPYRDFYSLLCGKFTNEREKPLEGIVATLRRKVNETVGQIEDYKTTSENSILLPIESSNKSTSNALILGRCATSEY